MDVVTVVDCKSSNLSVTAAPEPGLMAGYGTGTPDVQWTNAQIAAHPGMVLFDQSPLNTMTDETLDVFDVENMAGTLADIVPWLMGARTSFKAGRRPGQRWPALYMSRSTLTPAANVMTAAIPTITAPIWLAAPMPEQAAIDTVMQASGPFPIIGVQYLFAGPFDVSVVSASWLSNVSLEQPPPPPAGGTQSGWRYCNKCKALFYGPDIAISVCAVGGHHDGSKSHNYTIGYIQ